MSSRFVPVKKSEIMADDSHQIGSQGKTVGKAQNLRGVLALFHTLMIGYWDTSVSATFPPRRQPTEWSEH
jgi:hypothetical protein